MKLRKKNRKSGKDKEKARERKNSKKRIPVKNATKDKDSGILCFVRACVLVHTGVYKLYLKKKIIRILHLPSQWTET